MNIELDLELADDLEPQMGPKGLKGWVQLLADKLFQNKKTTASSLLIVIASLMIVIWNLSRLSILDQLAKLEAQEFRLADQLEDLEFRLKTIDLERLTSEIDEENHRVFQGFPNLSAWAEVLSVQADQFELSFSYSVGKPHQSPVPNVLEVPMILKLQANQEKRDSAFANSTLFVESILRDRWHVDILATEAIGDSSGMASMRVDAQVWVSDRYGFSETVNPEPASQQAATFVAGR